MQSRRVVLHGEVIRFSLPAKYFHAMGAVVIISTQLCMVHSAGAQAGAAGLAAPAVLDGVVSTNGEGRPPVFSCPGCSTPTPKTIESSGYFQDEPAVLPHAAPNETASWEVPPGARSGEGLATGGIGTGDVPQTIVGAADTGLAGTDAVPSRAPASVPSSIVVPFQYADHALLTAAKKSIAVFLADSKPGLAFSVEAVIPFGAGNPANVRLAKERIAAVCDALYGYGIGDSRIRKNVRVIQAAPAEAPGATRQTMSVQLFKHPL